MNTATTNVFEFSNQVEYTFSGEITHSTVQVKGPEIALDRLKGLRHTLGIKDFISHQDPQIITITINQPTSRSCQTQLNLIEQVVSESLEEKALIFDEIYHKIERKAIPHRVIRKIVARTLRFAKEYGRGYFCQYYKTIFIPSTLGGQSVTPKTFPLQLDGFFMAIRALKGRGQKSRIHFHLLSALEELGLPHLWAKGFIETLFFEEMNKS